MWKEITAAEFWNIHSTIYADVDRVDNSNFVDFIEVEYVDEVTGAKIIKRTEQQYYAKETYIPSTHRYYLWEE